MEKIALSLNIKNPKVWGNVSTQQIRSLGGSYILNQHEDSISKYPRSYWDSVENRKYFLDELSTKLNIKEPKEWGRVTTHRIRELGGASLLNRYNGSLFNCLQSLYEGSLISIKELTLGVDWKVEWFPKFSQSYWNSMKNRRRFLDEVAHQLEIQNPKDWGKVTIHKIRELGGNSLLHHYGNSLFACLQSVYRGKHFSDA